MTTVVLPVDKNSIEKAAEIILSGGVVAIPTETVYGLAANALDESAVSKIFEAKGRPQDNPLIAHICNLDMANMVASRFPDKAMKLAEYFWPGPLTIILPRAKTVADNVCAGLGSVGVRMPSHNGALQLIQAAGVPLAAPSANISGSPSPTSAKHVYKDLSGKIPLILDGGSCGVGLESTVVSMVGQPVILRPGAVTSEMIADVIGESVAVAPEVTKPHSSESAPPSPGMKYRHYSPKASITILEGGPDKFAAYVNSIRQDGTFALCFEGEQALLDVPCVTFGRVGDADSQAESLFDSLRMLDEKGAKSVFARCPDRDGIGLAVYNRLLRAAGFRVKKL